jgi:hypothetical protein
VPGAGTGYRLCQDPYRGGTSQQATPVRIFPR